MSEITLTDELTIHIVSYTPYKNNRTGHPDTWAEDDGEIEWEVRDKHGAIVEDVDEDAVWAAIEEAE